MKRLIRTYLFYLTALFIATHLFGSSFTIDSDIRSWLTAALILSLLNTLLKPILSLLFFPINALTLGVFSIVVNSVVFYLFLRLVPQVHITSWTFPGYSYNELSVNAIRFPFFGTIVLLSMVVSLITNFLAFLVE